MTMMQGLSLTGVPLSATAKKRGESWLHDCLTHVKSMHKVLACLYGGLETDGVYDDDLDDDKIASMDGDSTRLGHLFSDHCYRLVKRMSDRTNGAVEFPLSQIITVLNRCLSLSFADVLSVPSRTDLVPVLPNLHQCCMDVLSQLISCCGRDVLHQSRTIIDLCLQTIVSTNKMPLEDKCRTRSSTYQALVLWVKACGWGKYLSSHRKLLMQEIVNDTLADEEDGLAKKDESDESKYKKDKSSGREKKGKKKKGQRGDSYMELELKDDKGNEESNAAREDLVLWALSLAQLSVENLPFSLSQTLISHLIKTASSVQRLSPTKPHPYHQTEARKSLYQAVAGCLLSSLESTTGNRNDAVSHYQLTNSALDLLVRACHTDHPQVQTVCSQALAALKSSSNLKGPVIRKVLDFDDSGVEDVSHLLRENERQSDYLEDLRQKLMSSEMENEQQYRLISSLREQITTLQNKVSQNSTNNSSQLMEVEKVYDNKGDDNEDDDSDDDNDDNDDKTKATKDEMDDSAISDESRESPMTEEMNTSVADVERSKSCSTSQYSQKKDTLTSSSQKDSTNTDQKVDDFGKDHRDSQLARNKSMKRTNEAGSSLEKDCKKSKMDHFEDKANNGIENMLLDFVDAPPDL